MGVAAARCNALLESAGIASRVKVSLELKQASVSKLIDEARVRLWDQRSLDVCNRRAYSAPLAGKVLGVVPSKTLDKYLTRSVFVTDVALCLGVDVFDPATSCPFCGIAMDTRRRHALSCMCGGDAILVDNTVRTSRMIIVSVACDLHCPMGAVVLQTFWCAHQIACYDARLMVLAWLDARWRWILL